MLFGFALIGSVCRKAAVPEEAPEEEPVDDAEKPDEHMDAEAVAAAAAVQNSDIEQLQACPTRLMPSSKELRLMQYA